MSLSEPLERWRARGRFARVRDMDVFHVVEGAGPTVLVLHGFPTNSYDWHAALPALTAGHRVILADMPGYGLSSKPHLYSYSLVDQADVLLELWQRLGVTAAHLVAHDMGTSVACELIARRAEGKLPIELHSVTLMNGSVHLEMARLTSSQRVLRTPLLGRVFARLASRTVFRFQFKRLFGRPDAVPERELNAMWELLTHGDGQLRLPRIIRYLEERVQRAPRWLPPLGRLDIPVMVLWGRRDPVAVFAIAERLARDIPGAQLVWLDELGHYPMVEDPKRVTDAVLGFIGE